MMEMNSFEEVHLSQEENELLRRKDSNANLLEENELLRKDLDSLNIGYEKSKNFNTKLLDENESLRKELDSLNSSYDKLEEYQDRSTKVGSPVIFDNSHVFKQMIASLEEENNYLKEEKKEKEEKEDEDKYKPFVTKNKWTEENEKTVKKWQIDIEKTGFIYGEVLMTTTFYMNLILVTTLILSVLNTLFAALSVTLVVLDVKWVGITFEILILICSAIAAVLTGILKIFALDLRVQDLTRYVEKLNNSWFLFEIEMDISPDQRSDAHDFIKRADGQYLSLMQQNLPIDANEYSKANRNFQKRALDNHLWGNNFKKHMKQQMQEV